jgi:hypothetical protein
LVLKYDHEHAVSSQVGLKAQLVEKSYK